MWYCPLSATNGGTYMLTQLLCYLGHHDWQHLRSVGIGKMDRKGNYQRHVRTEHCPSCQLTRKSECATLQPTPVQRLARIISESSPYDILLLSRPCGAR